MTLPQGPGRRETWTTEQMLDALKRVYAAAGSCTQLEYSALRLDTEPSERTIRIRFGNFNRAKIRAGLPITVKVRKVTRNLIRGMPQPERTTYPCWKCHKPFKGIGRKRGNWHCHECSARITEKANAMAWLG